MGPPKRGFTNTSDLGFSLLKLKPGNQKVLNNAMVNKHCNVPLPKELDRISQFLEWVDREWKIRRSNFGKGSESYVTKSVQALVVEKIFSKRSSVVRMPRFNVQCPPYQTWQWTFRQDRHSLCFRPWLRNERWSEQREFCHIALNPTASYYVTLCQMCDNKAHYKYSFPFVVIYFKS